MLGAVGLNGFLPNDSSALWFPFSLLADEGNEKKNEDRNIKTASTIPNTSVLYAHLARFLLYLEYTWNKFSFVLIFFVSAWFVAFLLFL